MNEKEALRKHLSSLGKKGGPKGGKARMASLTPEERSTLASNAAKARWDKPKKPTAKSADVRTAKAAKKPAGRAQKPTPEG